MAKSPPAEGLAATPAVLFKNPVSRDPLRDDLFGQGFLETYARDLAVGSFSSPRCAARPLLNRLSENGEILQNAHRRLNEATRAQESLTPDAEWLLDNFYVIEEVLREIRHDMPRGYYMELPRLTEGEMEGYPRVYALALGLISHTDSSLNGEQILNFVQAYQTMQPLAIGELWAVPTMLRLGLIENLRRLAEQLVEARDDRDYAERWVDEQIGLSGGDPTKVRPPERLSDPAVVGILQALRDRGRTAQPLITWLEEWLAERGRTTSDVLRREHRRQANNQVSIGNCVTSIRLLNALDWNDFFERTSVVEMILRQDPSSVYLRQDFTTRDRCRSAVEKLGRGSGKPESEVARQAIRMAAGAEELPADDPKRLVAYYLIDDGRRELARALHYEAPRGGDALREWLLSHPLRCYFCALAFGLTLLLVIVLAFFPEQSWVTALVMLAVLVIPVTELAVGIVNYMVTHLLPPRPPPKLDFKDGIPAEFPTIVVIPTMLTKPESARSLVERLELHYLANNDPQLYFALLTDFADAASERTPNDEAVVTPAIDGIRRLNARYAPDGPERFFLFHRKRQWNASENCWMGWERKRGKLLEFDRLLHGAGDSSYAVQSGDISKLPKIQYVLTLDSDTNLPRETARRLVSTLAHPLNKAVLNADKTRVIRGYGVLQPRVSFLYQTGLRSRFARVFASSAGIDPYAAAVSDVYQDLFGAGSYTGKGIYDVEAFAAVTGPAFPDNHILSHDLIESNFARCGLVTDIEVLDDYPAKYHAFARRELRWARGDWQLLPWLGATTPAAGPNGTAIRRPNVLGWLERWKVFDNLRRSLVAPSLLVLAIVGWTVLPGPAWFWTLLVLMVAALPLMLHVTGSLIAFKGGSARPVWRNFIYNLPATAAQVALTSVFIADQARLMATAIAVTLFRLFVTRKRLLEWETAAAAEQRLGSDLKTFMRSMAPASIIAAAMAGIVANVRPEALPGAAPLFVAWLVSPIVAWWVSLPLSPRKVEMKADDARILRRLARKTWGFFETFVGDGDHWLPPDNFQEDPKGEIAHRTSPTNKGLLLLSTLAAHDLGYLGLTKLLERLDKTVDTLEKLEKYRGHLFNWYETTTLHVLPPAYVSTVDSGNFLACLIVLKNGLMEKLKQPLPNPACAEGLRDVCEIIRDHIGEASQARHQLDKLLEHVEQPPADDLLSWDDWFSRVHADAVQLKSAAAKSGGELIRWCETLVHQIEIHHGELTGVFPWLALARASTSGSPTAAWSQWLAGIIECRSVSSVHDCVPDWIAALELNAEPSAETKAKFRLAFEQSSANRLIGEAKTLAQRSESMAGAMDFRFLFNSSRNLFSIGYNQQVGRLDNAHYDLLASECRITSFLAVARGEVSRKHWFQLGRPVTSAAGMHGLLSWGGTMFEFLMPRLVLPTFPDTLLDEAERAAVARQMEYGLEHGVPWGVSESGYYMLDPNNQDYQYQSFGVPGLGLKRGLTQDMVVAPYATMMSAMINPPAVCANLERLRADGGEGPFGVYEALDYTRNRLEPNERCRVVKQYMAHHQGMGMLALTNQMTGNIMPKRLRQEPMVRAAELLLQERVPLDAPVLESPSEEEGTRQVSGLTEYAMSRRLTTADTPGPRSHVLSNGQYTIMLTNAGSGFSTCRGLDVTRWREDRTRDCYGQFIYIRDVTRNRVWCATHQPICQRADRFEAVFSIDKAEFRRWDFGVETYLETTVSPEKNVEVRRVTLTNHGLKPVELEVTSYAELALLGHVADLAHPAFGKLFLETEWIPALRTILCRRRPRAADQNPVFALHSLAIESNAVGPTTCETDRMRFIGRRRSTANPAALENGANLSGTVGPVLDPIFSLRQSVRLESGSSVTLAFSTAVADSRDEALGLADQYNAIPAVTRCFDLGWAQARAELRHLRVSVEEALLFQRLVGHVLYPGPNLRAPADIIKANKLGQPGLWTTGVSGDWPIVVCKINTMEDLPLVRQLLNAHAYWRINGMKIDLIFLNLQPGSYVEEVQQQTLNLARTLAVGCEDQPGGFFVRKASLLPEDVRTLLQAVARVVLDGGGGPLADQIDVLERQGSIPAIFVPRRTAPPKSAERLPERTDLQFNTGLGGFTKDGKEYVITFDPAKDGTPVPWVNVVANPNAGFVATESGGGNTWAFNSQANRLTSWSNDPVSDTISEAMYIRDEETGAYWTPTALPVPHPSPVRARHGQGYTAYERICNGIEQELRLSVPPDDPVKLIRLKVTNRSNSPRKLTATFFAELVLGTTRDQTIHSTFTELDVTTGAVFARNPYSMDFSHVVAFVDCSQRPRTFTGDRTEFLGRNGFPASPAAMSRVGLSGRTGVGLDPCVAIQTPIELAANESKEVVFVLGQAETVERARALVAKYKDVWQSELAFRETVSRWDHILTAITVHTPYFALDLLMNRWLLYQSLACRFWGRSAFFQSGGAFGYRDQLQDAMAFVHADPAISRGHILHAAAHQFPEGDVQHWWHPPAHRGIRTHFSDDYLWLPYVTAFYLATTGDVAILEELAAFVSAPELKEGEEEVYGQPQITEEKATLYDHCCRAIDHASKRGVHGLPLMGTGDWNDGMNKVGAEGKGESVWVAWFLLTIYRQFTAVAEKRGDAERATRYKTLGDDLLKAIEDKAWDGEWYRRAYFDDGTPLGSRDQEECQIDSLPQSWAVLSGEGNPERARRAMAAVDQRLVKRDGRLILLFDPPFDQTPHNPGYIKGYLPGIRENGGQYTHAAIWVIAAAAGLKQGRLAMELVDIMNPVRHTDTAAGVQLYKVEPYVIAADVYGRPPHTGRGGWTWYTGSASWYYRVVLESILGFQRRGDRITINPVIPHDWKAFDITYRHGKSPYKFWIENPKGVEHGVAECWLDGVQQTEHSVRLIDDGQEHHVRLVMG